MEAVELCYTPAGELGRLIRARQLSPVELTEAVLARIERLDPRLNAFLTVTAEHARELARAAEGRAMRGELLGPLDGIPYSIKDLEATAGIRTTLGSRFTEDHVPGQDSVLAGRLRRSGAVLLGKTNTPHIGYKDMTDNLLGPPCRNPWDLARTAGGSSGGAGAAVAAGLGPLAHGSDGAGSVRIPAALCGVFGLKPSFGRIPSWPSADLWAARSHPGPLARTVRDAALLLQVMAGPDPRDPLSIDAPPPDFEAACAGDLSGLRVAWSPDLGYAAVDPEVAEATAGAARRFADLGCSVEEARIDWGNPSDFHRIIYSVQHAVRLGERAGARPDWIEPTLMRMVLEAGSVSAIELGRALLARTAFAERVRPTFERYDLLLTPQMPVAAWPADPGPFEGVADLAGRPARSLFERSPFTYPFNLTGQPAASVPCGFTRAGLPVGLQVVGRWHREPDVLRAAAAFEALQPWAGRRPPL
jgi:Asp-tRNA(Asn)/Glu-tRNA(Gln) amidotransferase A subunit family amidase